MKTLITAAVVMIIACLSAPFVIQAQLITPPENFAHETARSIALEMNDEFSRRVGLHKRLFSLFWRNDKATPEAIAAALGNQAVRLFQLSSENLSHIDRLAELLGKDVSDFIAAEDRVPPRIVTPNPNGTVTIAP